MYKETWNEMLVSARRKYSKTISTIEKNNPSSAIRSKDTTTDSEVKPSYLKRSILSPKNPYVDFYTNKDKYIKFAPLRDKPSTDENCRVIYLQRLTEPKIHLFEQPDKIPVSLKHL